MSIDITSDIQIKLMSGNVGRTQCSTWCQMLVRSYIIASML